MLRGRPDLAGARDRIDALTAELDDARRTIADLMREPQRVGGNQGAERAPEDATALRQARELHDERNAALRDAHDAALQRDALTSRVHFLEAELARVSDREKCWGPASGSMRIWPRGWRRRKPKPRRPRNRLPTSTSNWSLLRSWRAAALRSLRLSSYGSRK